ncbi:hypothetical protein RJT34_19164 [Clitoria ternatea]|uniref:Calmodulin-binding protein n=1 Tax=Clitoria ternatea TaxID=43366 RepID=A0AAN9P310_CLITE
MVSNRQSSQKHQGSGKIPIQEPKRSYGDTKQPSISLRNVINAPWINDHTSYVETFLRRVVREEVERKIQGYLFSRKGINQAGISGAKPLQLCFIKKLPDTIYTQSNIIAEDESTLQIALFDVRSKSIVNEGPLSSLRIEICVLNGEFGSHGSEDWTEDEFNANILRERDGKEPLLIGERFVTLQNGVGCVTKVTLTDNSRWQRSRRFRLGAKAAQPTTKGENIQEGRSEPFVVKDNRGESYKKHYPPFLNDDTWRLKKIAKEGKIHKQLSFHGIHTVKDLLRLYITNESSLYQKFGNIPRKSWISITEHARTCQSSTLPGCSSPFITASYTDEGMNDYQIYADQLQDIGEMPQNSHVEDEFSSGIYIEEDTWHLNGSNFPFVQGGYSIENENSEIEFINGCPPYSTWELGTECLSGSSIGAECSSHSTFLNSTVDISSSGKPKAVWCKIRFALKWVISVKREAAAKKNAKLFYYNY